MIGPQGRVAFGLEGSLWGGKPVGTSMQVSSARRPPNVRSTWHLRSDACVATGRADPILARNRRVKPFRAIRNGAGFCRNAEIKGSKAKRLKPDF
jgi:hypothetical protein